jgi:hypothetical protein
MTGIRNFDSLLLTPQFNDLQKMGMELTEERNQFDLVSVFEEIIDENAWSRLFAYLFDSNKSHGLKQRALREWLKIASDRNDFIKKLVDSLPSEDDTEALTITEWTTENNRRLDIKIEIQDALTKEIKAVIGIENKVDSGEQIEQLSDYQKSLSKFYKNVPKLIFFLTPDGRTSLTSDDALECRCISYSYLSIIQVCQKLKPNSGQLFPFLSIMENHIAKLIKYNRMEKDIRNLIHELYSNPKYNEALKLIAQYSPSIQFVFENLRENFKSFNKSTILVKKYNYQESGKYITNEVCEFQYYLDDFENLSGQIDIHPRYYLKSKTLNPDIGDEITVRLILYCGILEGKDKRSKDLIREKILKVAEIPDSKGQQKHWWCFVNTWVGQSYVLKDLGNKDIDGLTKLLCSSINQTYEQLKLSLQKLAKNKTWSKK